MTYWLINAPFLVVAVALAIAATIARRGPDWRAIAVAGGVVIVATAIFDNVMIAIGLVAYGREHISGVFVGLAPIEDFAYAVAAVIGLPSLWSLLVRRPKRDGTTVAADATA